MEESVRRGSTVEIKGVRWFHERSFVVEQSESTTIIANEKCGEDKSKWPYVD